MGTHSILRVDMAPPDCYITVSNTSNEIIHVLVDEHDMYEINSEAILCETILTVGNVITLMNRETQLWTKTITPDDQYLQIMVYNDTVDTLAYKVSNVAESSLASYFTTNTMLTLTGIGALVVGIVLGKTMSQ